MHHRYSGLTAGPAAPDAADFRTADVRATQHDRTAALAAARREEERDRARDQLEMHLRRRAKRRSTHWNRRFLLARSGTDPHILEEWLEAQIDWMKEFEAARTDKATGGRP